MTIKDIKSTMPYIRLYGKLNEYNGATLYYKGDPILLRELWDNVQVEKIIDNNVYTNYESKKESVSFIEW